MAVKLSLKSVLSSYSSLASLNSNFEAIATAFDNTVSRDGSGPNQMNSSFNMNGFPINNVGPPASLNDVARLQDLNDVLSVKLLGSGAVADSLGVGTSIAPSQRAVAAALANSAVSISDFPFFAVGDGSDETSKLTAFWLHAIANPGIVHRLENKTYGVSNPLPEINTPNVVLMGAGAELHDTGPVITGTVLKWLGGVYSANPLQRIRPVSSSTGTRIQGVIFKGIGIDHSNGNLKYGLEVMSARQCEIDLVTANPGNGGWGLSLNVVPQLGESRDTQRNHIRHRGRMIEGTGFGVTLNGDATANVSMNSFEFDYVHHNNQAVYDANSDNNDWLFLRCLKTPTGTATESVSLLGSNSVNQGSRDEIFHHVSVNTPIHVYGSSSVPSFTYPSTGHRVLFPDFSNYFPAPTVDAGGRIDVDGVWFPYSPVFASGTGGAPTCSILESRYTVVNNVVSGNLVFQITSVSGTGDLLISPPIKPLTNYGFVGNGINVSSKTLLGVMYNQTDANIHVFVNNGGSPIVNGNYYEITFSYEVSP